MSPQQPNVLTIASRPFGENSFVAWMDDRTDCLVVDPGLEPGKIIAAIEDRNLTPVAILITHGHTDHIGGKADKLTDPKKNLSARFGIPFTSPPADRLINEGDVIDYAGLLLEVREIPGHSTGHVVFVWRDGNPSIVFGGDVLFAGSVGRTDFPDGSFEQLAAGIREKLFTLPDETTVFSGHGPPTTIGEEKRTNPFVGILETREG